MRSPAWAAPPQYYPRLRPSAAEDEDPDAPAMMEPGVPDREDAAARPSLLAFRGSRVLRATHRQLKPVPSPPRAIADHAAQPGGWPRASAAGDDDDWYASSEDTEDERGTADADADADALLGLYTHAHADGDAGADADADGSVQTRERRATTLTAYLGPPPSSGGSSIPMMGDEDEVIDVDAIVCDPRRLPRSMLADDSGLALPVPRESLLLSAAASDRSSVIKSGLLFKQGALRGRLVPAGGWKVRFAALSASALSFYREEHGRKRGELRLAGRARPALEVMPKDSVFDGSSATMWRFALRLGGRRVLLAAYTEAEMKDWLRCLHVALAVAHGAGAGRFTDVVVPSGTFLAGKPSGAGPLRSSGFH